MHIDELIASDDTIEGIAIIKDGLASNSRRWLLKSGEWSSPTPQTQVDWPDDAMIFHSHSSCDAYCRRNLAIRSDEYGSFSGTIARNTLVTKPVLGS